MGVLLLLLLWSGLLLRIAASQTAELRLEHARGEAANIRDKLGIFGSPFDLERDCRTPCALASIQNSADGRSGGTPRAAGDTAKDPAEGSGSTALLIGRGIRLRICSAAVRRARICRPRDRNTLQRRRHLEIQIILRVDISISDERAERWHNGIEILRLKAIRSDANLGGQFFDVQVLAGMNASKGSHCRKFRAQIKV